MEDKLLLEEIKKQLEIKFPNYTFEIFEDKFIGCNEMLDMIITCDIDENIFCYGFAAEKFKHWLEDKYECKIKVKGREDD